jgi:translation initiation factor IF-3
LNRPNFPSRGGPSTSFVRVNGKIRAREVRVIGPEGNQMGIMALNDALGLARQHGVDLVEVAPNATPPVCRVIDYGKYRYEQAKKEKESRKHQHSTKLKEIQLSANIDPHDFGVKLAHAIEFLCHDMKVKVSLRFRGREMAHQEFGHQVVGRLIKEVAPYATPDNAPKLIGKSITVILTPLPRNKRAKSPNLNPEELLQGEQLRNVEIADEDDDSGENNDGAPAGGHESTVGGKFANNPFSNLNIRS